MNTDAKELINGLLGALDFEGQFGEALAKDMRDTFAEAVNNVTEDQARTALAMGVQAMVVQCLEYGMLNLQARINQQN